MFGTLIYGAHPPFSMPDAPSESRLWLAPGDLASATGWESKPEGLCHGDTCVPIPAARKDEFLDPAGRVDLAAFAQYLGKPVVRDEVTHTWLVGESATARRDALRSREAPDFALPDLDGTIHALSDYRGKKVLLLTWASW